MKELITTDVLIIGSGIAGDTAALFLAELGLKVTLVTKAESPKESNTYYAQGGIIYRGEGDSDSPEKLTEDILRAGAGVTNPRAARILAEEGPSLVEKTLIKYAGVKFNSHGEELERTREGGHSLPRIVHVADTTGRSIAEALSESVKKHKGITLLTNVSAVDLLTPAHHSLDKLSVYSPLSCIGAYLFDQKTAKVSRVLSRQTVLATGGLGQIFEFTTNPSGARGDGIAMAYRAGARIINLEYVQFHPTAFFYPGAPRFLITEAVRGEGGKLVDKNGTPFMEKYNREWKDLAPRDIVARSIYREMMATGEPCMYLDLKNYIPKEKILTHFPNIHKTLLNYGIDITKDLVPVVPAAHYSCGGVWVDTETGETTVKNLFAVGEVACNGLHGANRLASTSLLEGLVWGTRSAKYISKTNGSIAVPDGNNIRPWQDLGNPPADSALVFQDMKNIKGLMWNYVGLVRNTERLGRARVELGHLERSIEQFYQKSRVSDELLGLRNMAQTAVLVAESAWVNRESAGCHFRE